MAAKAKVITFEYLLCEFMAGRMSSKQGDRKLRAYGRKCLEAGRDIQCELERYGHPGNVDLESLGLKGYKP